MAKKQQGKSQKEQFATYKTAGSYSKNKTAKLKRHLKRFPSDEQAAIALKSVSATPTRKKPANSPWSATTLKLATLFRSVGIKGNAVLDVSGVQLQRHTSFMYTK